MKLYIIMIMFLRYTITQKKKQFLIKRKNNITEIYERKRLNIKKVKKLLRKNSVILLNVNRYSLFKQIFPTRKWARVIIDEMDTIPIPIAFDEFGNFNWFITATPTSILN